MTEHFTLAEVESHRLCEKHGFDKALNRVPVVKTPGSLISTQAEWHAACEILEVARRKLGKPVVVSCGYRCPELNMLAGGEPTSQHQGYYTVKGVAGARTVIQSVAFDLQTADEDSLSQLHNILLNFPHDQLIMEDRKAGKDWIHWSWNPYYQNRFQHFTLQV